MATVLAARAEVQRLARLLDVEPERVAFLERVAPADLRALRLRVSDVLFDADRSTLQKVAAAARFLPAPLAASFAERFFGPVLGARIAGLLERGRAVDLAKRLPAPFLAELSVALDPRRIPEVLAGIPAGKIVEVAKELARREDYATMASFVPHLSDETLLATTEVVDDAGLLLIGFHMDSTEGLDHLVDLLPEERLRGILRAAGDVDLGPEALTLLNGVSEARRKRLTDLAAEEGVLERLMEVAKEEGLGDEVAKILGD
jgi:hypothetical protein